MNPPEDAFENTADFLTSRLKKLGQLRDAGIDPYPAHFHRSDSNAEIGIRFQHLSPDEFSNDRVIVAGRLFASRNSGMFLDLQDSSARLQVFTHSTVTAAESLAVLELLDLGDFIGVTGYVRRTKRGELTVNAEKIEILCKALRPMPAAYHGIRDTETRYRKRYLDVMVNSDSRLRLQQRSQALSIIRSTMESDGFLEVETPMLHSVYGGATARPFRTHHNALHQDMYLRIAPELYLKRLLVAGLSDRIFEVNRNFRNEGLSTRHNPEFTMLEAYWAFADYTDAMDLTERLFRRLAQELRGSLTIDYGDATLDFSAPFRRLPMPAAVEEVTGIDFMNILSDQDARCAAKEVLGEGLPDDTSWGEALAEVFERRVEGSLMQPIHVTHFPKDISPFAKAIPGEARLVERFETYCNGWEICNAFSELNDPVEQRRRMNEQVSQAQLRGEGDRVLDEDFLEAIEHGMPPAAGLGIGIDRLIMLMTNASSIRDVIAFPALRAKE